MKAVYSLFLIIFFCLSLFNKSQAINLSDYSKEEREQYKQIKKLKADGVTGKNYINEKHWIKDKKNFYHNIASFHTGIEGLRLKNKRMPILGLKKVGHNWGWKPSGEKRRVQAAFSVIGNGTIENGEMGMIKSKKHAWHGEEFYQITGSYENCNPQYWDWNECTHGRGAVHNESRDTAKWTRLVSKDGNESWLHIATKPIRNVLFQYNKYRKFTVFQCHPRGDVITFMIKYRYNRLELNLQGTDIEKNYTLKEFEINEHNGADEWTSLLIQFVNSSDKDKGKFVVWVDGKEKPVVQYNGRTHRKNRIPCFLAAGIYVNGAKKALDFDTIQDSTVWADAVAIAKTKEKLLKLIEKKDK